MMRPLFLCLSFCCLWQLGMGQYLHTPSDFDKKIGSSSITYLLDSLFEPPAAQNMPLVTAGWIAVPRDGGVRLIAPSLETQTARAKYRVKGDNFFEKGKFLKAAANYEKLAPAGGTDVELMKRLGESYRKGGNWEKASYWYTQAIDANFIDFVAHQRLAECYEATDNGEKAIHHITLAHLLNRNDAGILGAVRKMYEANGHPFANYEFVPGYELSQPFPQEVRIRYSGEVWKAYAKCKAVWKYEEEHQEKMRKLSNAPLEEIAEKECLLSAIIMYGRLDSSEQQAYPEFESLGFAIGQQKINDYILYELKAPQEPLVMSRLPRQKLLELAGFVRQLRTQ